MAYTRLAIVIFIATLGVIFRDSLPNFIKLILAIVLIAGTCWSAVTEPNKDSKEDTKESRGVKK